VRSFIAVSPDAATREQLAALVAPLRATFEGVRWVRDPHLHITLAFLGDLDGARLQSVIESVRPVIAALPAFRLSLAGGGAFPDWSRPRVVWLGSPDAASLTALATGVRAACERAGWKAEGRFTPHLTIGRMKRPLSAEERGRLRKAISDIRVPHPFDVSRVEVLHSVLEPGGPRHTLVEALPLRSA
jgi:2'-5' RNA ligase